MEVLMRRAFAFLVAGLGNHCPCRSGGFDALDKEGVAGNGCAGDAAREKLFHGLERIAGQRSLLLDDSLRQRTAAVSRRVQCPSLKR